MTAENSVNESSGYGVAGALRATGNCSPAAGACCAESCSFGFCASSGTVTQPIHTAKHTNRIIAKHRELDEFSADNIRSRDITVDELRAELFCEKKATP